VLPFLKLSWFLYLLVPKQSKHMNCLFLSRHAVESTSKNASSPVALAVGTPTMRGQPYYLLDPLSHDATFTPSAITGIVET
jgi:hypothetical protein